MKALTLRQPCAQLVAIGAKRIETRSWSTSYRGPLAIHAAKRPKARDVWFDEQALHRVGLCRDQGEATFAYGAVVATCRLVDVVPITGSGHGYLDAATRIAEFPHDGPLPHQQGGLWIVGPSGWQGGRPTRIEGERPFGDFSPGRYSWLLADVEPVDPPVPAKGRQGLWEWTP